MWGYEYIEKASIVDKQVLLLKSLFENDLRSGILMKPSIKVWNGPKELSFIFKS